jgi:adenylate cyclase
MTEAQKTVRDVSELTCWFLLMDIENFVHLSSDLPAEELARMVGTWLAECQKVIENHGGALSKFLGDGMLVYWNARYCDLANVAAALNVLQSMQSRRQPPFRWTLHYGTAVFGAAVAAGELSALGQDLNFLFRMERLAATLGFPCLISEAARVGMATHWKGQPLGAFLLKGFESEYAFFSW